MDQQNEHAEPMVLEPITRTVEIPVSNGNIFRFPDGVPAFEDYKEFVLYCNTEMQPFFFMKSIGVAPEISFVCIDPFLICPDYRIRVGQADLKALDLKRCEDSFAFSFVTLRDNPCDITCNLQGPVVLNLKKGIGRQIISEGTSHDVRFRVWDALMEMEETQSADSSVMMCG